MITRSNRRWIAAVSVIAFGAVTVVAFVMLQPHPRAVGDLAAGGHGGLQVRQDVGAGKRESGAPLRCFVEGRFVGEMTIESCAQRNGVSAQGLDVGLAAPSNSPASDASLPPEREPDLAVASALPATRAQATTPLGGDGQACLRFADDGWRTVGRRMPLAACVRALYEGHCVDPGEALYGRSGELTLRLVPGRVESSDDDRRFRFVMTQNDDCTLDG